MPAMKKLLIMRNVGAANWFIKTPFMIEGMVIGFMGAVIPVIFTFVAYNMLYKSLGGVFFHGNVPAAAADAVWRLCVLSACWLRYGCWFDRQLLLRE